MDFTPINTQEEFDAAISERLKREQKKYEGYRSPYLVEKMERDHQQKIDDLTHEKETAVSELQTQLDAANATIAEHVATIADRDKQIAKYETDSVKTRIAIEEGLPVSFAERLTGTTEDEIRNDAKSVMATFGELNKPAPVLPGVSSEPAPSGKKETLDDALMSMIASGN